MGQRSESTMGMPTGEFNRKLSCPDGMPFACQCRQNINVPRMFRIQFALYTVYSVVYTFSLSISPRLNVCMKYSLRELDTAENFAVCKNIQPLKNQIGTHMKSEKVLPSNPYTRAEPTAGGLLPWKSTKLFRNMLPRVLCSNPGSLVSLLTCRLWKRVGDWIRSLSSLTTNIPRRLLRTDQPRIQQQRLQPRLQH